MTDERNIWEVELVRRVLVAAPGGWGGGGGRMKSPQSEPPYPIAPLPSIRCVTSTLGSIESKDRLKNNDWEITRGGFLGKQVCFQTLSGGWLLQHWFGRKCWYATTLSSQTQTLLQPLYIVWHFKHESSTSDEINNKWGTAVPESSWIFASEHVYQLDFTHLFLHQANTSFQKQ